MNAFAIGHDLGTDSHKKKRHASGSKWTSLKWTWFGSNRQTPKPQNDQSPMYAFLSHALCIMHYALLAWTVPCCTAHYVPINSYVSRVRLELVIRATSNLKSGSDRVARRGANVLSHHPWGFHTVFTVESVDGTRNYGMYESIPSRAAFLWCLARNYGIFYFMFVCVLALPPPPRVTTC